MATPKKYIHDRLILLFLSANSFFALLGTILILIRLDSVKSQTFVTQYRSVGGLGGGFSNGSASVFFSFIAFSWFVLVFNIFLSVKTYPIKRYFAIGILTTTLLVLILSLIVSNALFLAG